jgi:endonuclease YncB( thermonuclease family)
MIGYRTRLSLLYFSIALWLLTPMAYAGKITGRVVHITSGDTIQLIDNRRIKHNIRLAGIDAPEEAQPFSVSSRQYLSSLIGSKTVTVAYKKRDRSGRIIGKIIHDGDVNLKMIRAGHAWWYRKTQKEQSNMDQLLYKAAEIGARMIKNGLWSHSDSMPPWEWRKRRKSAPALHL